MTSYRVRSGTPASPGNFYRELSRLQAQIYVETGVNPPDADARRIPYRITERGRGAFDHWLQAPPLSDGELSGWLLFAGRLGEADRERVLDSWQEQLWIRSQELSRQHREVVDAVRDPEADDIEHRSLRALVSRQLKHVAADLAFLEELRGDFKTWQATADGAAGHEPGDDPTSLSHFRRARS